MTILKSFRLWLIVAALCAVLVATSGPRHDSVAARIAHLESIVKCPSCEVLSVGQSTKPASLAIRAEITRKVHAGVSDQAIVASLESRYGTAIVLTPSTSGVGVLLWAVPVGGGAAALGILVFMVRRRT